MSVLHKDKPCPFGPELERYWRQRYEYFSRFDDGIKIDAEGLHTVMPEKSALAQARWLPGQIILDGFAGVGGCALAYAKTGKKVIAVELDEKRLMMAQHNARIYGVDHLITFICGDIFTVASTVKADVAHLDPPWGWPRQSKVEQFRMHHFGVDVVSLTNLLLKKFKYVALRVPANFVSSDLMCFERNFTIHEDKQGERVISKTVLLVA